MLVVFILIIIAILFHITTVPNKEYFHNSRDCIYWTDSLFDVKRHYC